MRILNFLRYRIRKFLIEEIKLEDYIKRGMKVGENCSIMDGSTFDYGSCFLITIGDNVTIAPQAYLLAHDASTKRDLGYTKIGAITIEDNVFIGARALIMPGVTVGKNSIVGAGSVVTNNVPENCIVAGNPAKVICNKFEYLNKNKELMKSSNLFESSINLRNDLSNEAIRSEMIKNLSSQINFLK